jgi:hypothetical protein
MLYVAVTDVDATVQRAKALGARVEVGPREIPGDTVPAPLEISWRELATTDREAATDFYAALFGWERQNAIDMGEPVGVYQEFGRPGISLGGIYRKPDDMPFPPHWLLYAKVPDLDASLAAARAAGGKVVMGPREIPGGDRIAEVLDPQGAPFALHQPKG